ncbi:MAG TPA: serine/threonine-protein kinase, partial [Polyangiaceae bacterium]
MSGLFARFSDGMARRATSQFPTSERPELSSASLEELGAQSASVSRPGVEGTLISVPSPDGGRYSEPTCTVEVRGVPPLAPLQAEERESATVALLRAWTPGVTHEHAGRYVVADDEAKSELGRGGIGRVYVAMDRHLEREVAIKELLPGVVEADGAAGLQAVSRFLREARVTGRLEHPNIVPVYELGKRQDGTLYYTMRVVRGRTLSRAIAEGKTLRDRLALVNHFSGLCQAIAYAHSRGVVHRDIKPDNVMIGEFGETVVLDWGMAKVSGPEPEEQVAHVPSQLANGELTLDGSLCGTPLYMSPEQAQGLVKDVDERSDVWALGVVLYTILVGKPPFTGRTVPEIVAQVRAGRFQRPRDVEPEIPAELAAVAERALRVEKRERYADAREIARDIQAYQAGARVQAYEYSSWELLKRFVARQQAAVIASAIGLFSVATLGVTAYGRVVAERDRAVLAEQRAVANEKSAKGSERLAKLSLAEVLVEKAQQALAEGERLD